MIGVKSTALLFGAETPKWMKRFLVATLLLMLTAILLATSERNLLSLVVAVGGAWAFGWHLVWQLQKLDIDDSDGLLALFRANRNAGLIPVLFFLVALFI